MIQKLQKVSTKAINLSRTKKQKNSNVFKQHNLLTIQQSRQGVGKLRPTAREHLMKLRHIYKLK